MVELGEANSRMRDFSTYTRSLNSVVSAETCSLRLFGQRLSDGARRFPSQCRLH